MTDPFDDELRSRAGFVVTATGLRVPVAAPAPLAGWPSGEAGGVGAPSEGRYRGVGPRGYQRSDAHVRDQVCERLLLDPYLDASRVVVRVAKGRVSLSGRVPTERMRSAAFAAAASVAGGAVDDAITVDAVSAAGPSRVAGRSSRQRAAKARKRGGSR